jgi:imidazolonepropionase-like amidohydrolase
LPDHYNLWKEPVAAILDPKRMFMPSDPATGESSFPSDAARVSAESNARKLWALNESIAKEHPRYLAASGASVFGSMPGISMHVELELFVRLGLTPREALAAATSNYADLFGWKELGLVTPRRRADLIVVDGDPTQEVRNARRISLVIVDGSVLDRPALLKYSLSSR